MPRDRLDGSFARWTPVQTAARNSTHIEITSGLRAGDIVATPRQPGLDLDGRRVSAR